MPPPQFDVRDKQLGLNDTIEMLKNISSGMADLNRRLDNAITGERGGTPSLAPVLPRLMETTSMSPNENNPHNSFLTPGIEISGSETAAPALSRVITTNPLQDSNNQTAAPSSQPADDTLAEVPRRHTFLDSPMRDDNVGNVGTVTPSSSGEGAQREIGTPPEFDLFAHLMGSITSDTVAPRQSTDSRDLDALFGDDDDVSPAEENGIDDGAPAAKTVSRSVSPVKNAERPTATTASDSPAELNNTQILIAPRSSSPMDLTPAEDNNPGISTARSRSRSSSPIFSPSAAAAQSNINIPSRTQSPGIPTPSTSGSSIRNTRNNPLAVSAPSMMPGTPTPLRDTLVAKRRINHSVGRNSLLTTNNSFSTPHNRTSSSSSASIPPPNSSNKNRPETASNRRKQMLAKMCGKGPNAKKTKQFLTGLGGTNRRPQNSSVVASARSVSARSVMTGGRRSSSRAPTTPPSSSADGWRSLGSPPLRATASSSTSPPPQPTPQGSSTPHNRASSSSLSRPAPVSAGRRSSKSPRRESSTSSTGTRHLSTLVPEKAESVAVDCCIFQIVDDVKCIYIPFHDSRRDTQYFYRYDFYDAKFGFEAFVCTTCESFNHDQYAVHNVRAKIVRFVNTHTCSCVKVDMEEYSDEDDEEEEVEDEPE